jgi:hypothetical protein
MIGDDWLIRLAYLSQRADGFGMTADLASLSIVELWGVYGFLGRIASSTSGA